jgi:hypothetical protein
MFICSTAGVTEWVEAAKASGAEPSLLVRAVDTLGTLTFPFTLLVAVPFSTLCWVIATIVTKPVTDEQLENFYRKVRPVGPGWSRIARRHPDTPLPERMAPQWVNFGLGIVTVYTSLFGIGKIFLGGPILGICLVAVAIVCGVILWRRLSTESWEDAAPPNR